MEGVRYCGYVFTTAICCCFMLAVAQITDPSEGTQLANFINLYMREVH